MPKHYPHRHPLHPRYEVAEGEFTVVRGRNELTIVLPIEEGQPSEADVKFLHLGPPPCDPHHHHSLEEDTLLWKLVVHGGQYRLLICWDISSSETRVVSWRAIYR